MLQLYKERWARICNIGPNAVAAGKLFDEFGVRRSGDR